RRGDFEEVVDAVRRSLAEEHEVQAHGVVLVRMGTIPKTSSGKIQRHACREGFLRGGLEVVFSSVLESGPAVNEAAAADLDPEALRALAPEERGPALLTHLRRQAARALRVPASLLDPEQPLSAFGLDSAAAVELRNDVESAFGVALPLTELIEGMSLTQVAGRVLACLEAPTPEVGLPRLTAGPAATELPLSYGQQALWLIDRQHPGSAAYIIAGAARVRGALDMAALRRAFEALAERHPALRTTFHETDSGPVQRVGAATGIGFVEEDATAWNNEEVEGWLEEEAWRPFDVMRGPVLRVAVFQRSPDEHLLVLAVHHAVADFWSLEVLVAEFASLLREGASTASLPPLPVSYADYVRWQRELLAGPEGERLWAFWSKALAGRLPDLDLPTDRPRPRVPSQRGTACSFTIGEEAAAALRSLGRGLPGGGATLYTVLLTAFQTLLHRYGGQDDVLVGSPTAGRSAAALAGLVGYFVNPVVLRGDLSGDPLFAELLGRLRRTALDAFAHQDFPFPLLVERLQPERDPSRSPVFQTLFVLQKARSAAGEDLAIFSLGEPGAVADLGGLAIESVRLAPRHTAFDLALVIAETARGLTGTLTYSLDLFDGTTAVRMAGHLRTLLAAAAADPGRRLSELDLLTPAEQAQLQEWSQTRMPVATGRLVHEQVAEQAARTPETAAVVFGEGRLTYAELDAQARRLAGHLRGLGVGPDVLVGLAVERSPEMVVGLLGVLHAGGAFLPLDPGYPRERLELMFADARPRVVLTLERLLPGLPESAATVLCLDRDQESPALAGEGMAGGADLDNLAYVIYTSGSTGRPKGVGVTHRGLVNLCAAQLQIYGTGPQDRVLQFASPSFDASVAEITIALVAGAELRLADRDSLLPGPPLLALLCDRGITNVTLPPSALAALPAPGESDLPALRTLLVAGEACPAELAQSWSGGTAGRRVFNAYGPTEATVWATVEQAEKGRPLTIGRPVGNTRARVLDRRLRAVPAGILGELCLGGEGLARGYLGRPDLTAEQFVPDPAGEPGARLYRTGDLVRFLPDGRIEFLGRVDHQVKLRGFRIEPGEIELLLAGHPRIAKAVVIMREDTPGDRRLAAYVVPADPGASAGELAEELSAWLGGRLPAYMVPSALVILDALPLSPNGKVDRRALPAPRHDAGLKGRVAPRTLVEARLAEIWSEVLHVEGVGVEDDFFKLGGHSLLAAQVASRVRKVFGVDVPLGRLFEMRTVADLAAELETLGVGPRRAEPGNLVDLLRARAADTPDRCAFTFLNDSEEEAARLTYRELDERARAIGVHLERMGARGSRALLLYPPGLDFIAAFLGCLCGGVAAVPAYPPRSNRTLPRLRAIARDAHPAVALTTSALLPNVQAVAGQIPELAGVGCLSTDDLDLGRAAEWTDPGATAETLAFLQYTSGSTSTPKGVMVSHGNLLHNEAMIQRAFGQSERSRIVGWLPLYHDMGLIGNVLQPLYLGVPCVLMSPVTFLQKPLAWLRAISRYRATTSGGPNFAYELCTRKLAAEADVDLDLSCWEVAFNGAEPVRAETLERFARAFAPYGFRREAFYPCYGLAEATLFVSGGKPGSGAVARRFDGPALERGEAVPVEDESSGRELVGCGHAWMGQEVVVVDPETRTRCAPGRVGEIWVSGPSVAQGYWQRPDVTERDFQARLAGEGSAVFLRTGDLGFVSGGEIFVTGRIKDLLIIRGRNLYPQDLELTAERSHPDLRPGCGAAVAVEVGGEERLVVVHEVKGRRRGDFEEVVDAVRRSLAEEHEVQAHGVVLVRMGTIPKTSSGKIQRHACREGFLHGGLEVVFSSVLAGGPAVDEAAAADLDLDALRALAAEERAPALLAHLRRQAARALRAPASLLEPEQPLSALGLDSAAAVELRNDVESDFGVALPLAELIEGMSLADVAGRVLSRLENPLRDGGVPGLAAGPVVSEYPLSYGQQALWLIDRQHPGSAAYIIAGAARVRGPLHAAELRRALEALAERHPVLRTTFHEMDGEPVQRVGAAGGIGFVEEDATAWSDDEVESWLAEEAWRPFDLIQGPVLRVAVFHRSPDEHLLVLAVHHVVADFWSLEVLVGELGRLLREGASVASLPALPVSYADYVRWQRELLAGPEGERLWAFWSRALAGRLPDLALPTDRPRPRVPSQRGTACSFTIGEEAAAALRSLGRGLPGGGATLYTVLLTAFQTLLH
ncbi:MAG TPA: amino acid adenylation domain-containing protein, partial [Thermoanaerobaculia bacterium]|nr:amino acid adenylation domain-containing protein [Thermoanaerobaculia bacterium]